MKSVRFRFFIVTIAVLTLVQITHAANSKARIEKLPDSAVPQQIYPGDKVPLSLADTCISYLGADPYYFVYPWVVGDELYKAYQDPSANCTAPYPYTIQSVDFVLYYLFYSGTIYASVDVEAAAGTASCPKPGSMLAISPLYELAMDTGLYLVSIPLDTPVVVDGPFFVGLYFGPDGAPENAAVITDDVEAGCASYNDWGEGYVDLDTVYNDYGEKIFLGRLCLYATGTAGGGSGGGNHSAPAAEIINPAPGELVGTEVDLWARDAAGSDIIQNARFQYKYSTTWSDIGTDNDAAAPLRNAVTASGSGDGLSYAWNTYGLPEGNYQLRVIITDSIGQADTAVTGVYIDPTPPFPYMITPQLGDTICNGVQSTIDCSDEDLSYVTFEQKKIAHRFQTAIPIISQYLGGDNDNDLFDGNPAGDGEFGDYCSGPAAAAMAVRFWANKGYTAAAREGTIYLSDAQIVDRLFDQMKVADNLGTYDADFAAGLKQYLVTHGDLFAMYIDRTPDEKDIYDWVGNNEIVTMLGLSGDPGMWLTVAGFEGVAKSGNNHTFIIADPVSNNISDFTVRKNGGVLELNYFGYWKEIDVMIGIVPDNWTVNRTAIGIDGFSNDGWGTYWDTQSLMSDSLYFFRAVAVDSKNYYGSATALIVNTCDINFVSGDIDNNGLLNFADMIFLINYLYQGGPQPPLGVAVCDLNCDGVVNIVDALYMYRYFFAAGPPPQDCP